MAQFNSANSDFQAQAKTLFEVNMIANGNNGLVVSNTNPFPVTLSQGGSGVSEDSTFGLNVARGLIPGMSGVFKAGYNGSCQNNVEESIWSHSELYPWSAWATPGTLSCASTNSGDTGTLTIIGLNSTTWETQIETITLNGLTPVITTKQFARLNFAHYTSSTPNAGEIHISRNDTVVGHIEIGAGVAQGTQYTVPAGYTAYVMQGTANIGKGNDGTGYFKYRPYGGSFQRAMTFLLYQSTFDYTFAVPLQLPEKTDLDVTLIASNAGTAVTCEYGLLLIANS